MSSRAQPDRPELIAARGAVAAAIADLV